MTSSPHVMVRTGGTAVARTGQRTSVHATLGEFGYVKIWSPTNQGFPDNLVLVGEDPAGRVVYRQQRRISDALLFQTDVFVTWALWFPSSVNEADGTHAEVFAASTRYTLFHQPSGTEQGQIPIVTGKQWNAVFASADGPSATSGAVRGGTPSKADDDAMKQMVSLVATKFYAGDRFFQKPVGGATARVVDHDHAWLLGTPAPEATDSEAVAPLAGTQVWLSLFAAIDTSAEGHVWGATDDGPEAVRDRGASNGSAGPVLLGTWQVQPDGQYRHAAFGASADPAAVPAVTGPPAEYLLVPTTRVDDGNHTVHAHAFPAPPTRARVESVLADGLRVRRGAALTGFGNDALVPFAMKISGAALETDAPHVRWSPSEGIWKAYLPDPFRLPLELARQLEEALRVYEAWAGAASAALANVGLVATTCYDGGHRRTHLAQALVPAGRHNVQAAWRGREAGAPGAAPDQTLLGQFRYGIAQQQHVLYRDVKEAARALDAWAGGGLARGLACDLVALGRPGGDGAAADAGTMALIRALKASCRVSGAGVGAAVLASPFAARVRDARDLEGLTAAVRPFRHLEETAWHDVLLLPALELTFKLARKGSRVSAALFEAVGPAVSSSASVLRRSVWSQRVTGTYSRDAAVVLALFGDELLNGGAGGTPVFTGANPLDPSLTTTVWAMKDQRGVRVGPFEIDRIDITGIERTSSSGAVDSYWEIRYTRRADVGQVLSSGARLIDAGLAAANAAQAVIGVMDRLSDGDELRLRDAAALLKAASDLVGIWEKLGRPVGSIAKGVAFLGPYAEGFLALVEIYDALEHADERGSQDVPDVDGVSLIGGATLVLGVALGIAAAAVGVAAVATASAALAMLGTVLMGLGAMFGMLGQFIIWDRDRDLAALTYASDPLAPWLEGRRNPEGRPVGSVWGRLRPLSQDAFSLALPGWSPEAGRDARVTRAFEAQTEEFVQAAFTFPVDAVALPGGGLAFQVVPDYVPTAGTLLLSADVTVPGRDLVSVRAVIDYARMAEGYRFRVSAPGSSGVPGAVPAVRAAAPWPGRVTVARDGAVTDLSGAGWARSHEVMAARVAGGPAARHALVVRVGAARRRVGVATIVRDPMKGAMTLYARHGA